VILVGISGKAGTGKDYTQQTALHPIGFRPWSLAWHFKVWLVAQGKWTHKDVFVTKPPECRKDLQLEGTERGRNVFGEDIWCNVLGEWLHLIEQEWGTTRFVVPDVRFPNEVRAIQRLGGKVLRIHAPTRADASPLTSEARQHPSEIALDEVPLVDVPAANGRGDLRFNGVLFNDPGDEEVEINSSRSHATVQMTLARQVERHFDHFGWSDIADELFRESHRELDQRRADHGICA
jgi:hypothetical protein